MQPLPSQHPAHPAASQPHKPGRSPANSSAAPTEPRLQLTLSSTQPQPQPSTSALLSQAAARQNADQLAVSEPGGDSSIAATLPLVSSHTQRSSWLAQAVTGPAQPPASSVAATLPVLSLGEAAPTQPAQQRPDSHQRPSSVATTVPAASLMPPGSLPSAHSATQASHGPMPQSKLGSTLPAPAASQPVPPAQLAELEQRPPSQAGNIERAHSDEEPSSDGWQVGTGSRSSPVLQLAEVASPSEDVEVVLDGSDTSPAGLRSAQRHATIDSSRGAVRTALPVTAGLGSQAAGSSQPQATARPAAAVPEGSQPAADSSPEQSLKQAAVCTHPSPDRCPDAAPSKDAHLPPGVLHTASPLKPSAAAAQATSPQPSSTSGETLDSRDYMCFRAETNACMDA